MVWMRAAALRNFRKLWGRINQDIPAGTNVTIQIQNRWASCELLIHLTSSYRWIGGPTACRTVGLRCEGAVLHVLARSNGGGQDIIKVTGRQSKSYVWLGTSP